MEKIESFRNYLNEEDIDEFKKCTQGIFVNTNVKDEWKDYVFSPGFSSKAAKYVYNQWEPQEGDVFLFGYPRTGTTWTYEILKEILYPDRSIHQLVQEFPYSFKYIELEPCGKFPLLKKLPTPRRILVSHLPPELINLEKIKKPKAKIVYILRNPKDQMVSFYNFAPNVEPGQVEPFKSVFSEGWESYFHSCTEGNFPMFLKPGEWYIDHIRLWYPHLQDESAIILQYENLKKDLPQQLKRLAVFLDSPLSEERVQSIVESCSMGNMKKNHTQSGTKTADMIKAILQKGIVGGWKKYFTVTQSECIDEMVKEKLKGTDVQFTYEL